jgi:methionine aminopeptidase
MAAHIDGFIATIAHTVVVTEKAISGGIGNLITAADAARKEMVMRVQHGITVCLCEEQLTSWFNLLQELVHFTNY